MLRSSRAVSTMHARKLLTYHRTFDKYLLYCPKEKKTINLQMSKKNNYHVSSAYGKYFHHVVKTILRLRIYFISFSIFSIKCANLGF